MACRSVDNLRCRDDLMNVYRANASRSRRGRVKIRDIIEIIEILGPIIPHFFKKHGGANNFSSCGSMGYARDQDDMGSRFGFGMASGEYGNGSGHYGHSHGHGHSHSHGESHYGMSMGHVDDYADHEISEEEFEKLLDYAEQCNVRMY
ncbi:zinc transporter 7-like [Cucurbita moschata]|uniref:Zinc transporter 7-like n=1 Tax=Cucurbita moschata TaxID=3662 RepID=A0A6J1HD14_CUCMO|nr:zinc transporter 7-like [Cucurbita moschata]